MSNTNIRNFINSSSLGVYTKYVRVENGTKYLVKLGRGAGKSETSILEPVTECIWYELAKLINLDCYPEYYNLDFWDEWEVFFRYILDKKK